MQPARERSQRYAAKKPSAVPIKEIEHEIQRKDLRRRVQKNEHVAGMENKARVRIEPTTSNAATAHKHTTAMKHAWMRRGECPRVSERSGSKMEIESFRAAAAMNRMLPRRAQIAFHIATGPHSRSIHSRRSRETVASSPMRTT